MKNHARTVVIGESVHGAGERTGLVRHLLNNPLISPKLRRDLRPAAWER